MSLTLRLCRYSLFLVALFVFSGRWGHLFASPFGNCSDVCTGSSSCDLGCLIDYDTESTCGDYGTCGYYPCSDLCGPSADCTTTCGVDNDSTCGSYEGGQSSGECYGTCGDGKCNVQFETPSTCPADCTAMCGSGDPSCNPSAQDCASGEVCFPSGCCVVPCNDPSVCGGQDRSCVDGPTTCVIDDDCCDDEYCANVQFGYGGDMTTTGYTCWAISVGAPLGAVAR
jgi:hypothetical protein